MFYSVKASDDPTACAIGALARARTVHQMTLQDFMQFQRDAALPNQPPAFERVVEVVSPAEYERRMAAMKGPR